MSSSRAIVVLGMHRNGTSLLTRGLQPLDVYLGHDFFAALPDNPTGYWEDRIIQNLNDRILHAFGMNWDSIDVIDEKRWRETDLAPFRREAADHLRTNFLDHPLWGFKDPRTILLLPFWRPLFQELDVDDRYVVAVRNPLSVAGSLRRRQGMPAPDAHLLWLLYMVPHLHRIADRPFVAVDYDYLMADPPAQLTRVAQRLEIPLGDQQRAAMSEFARDFVKTGLRHYHFEADEFAAVPRIGLVSREAYLRLAQLAEDGLPDLDPFWTAWRRLTETTSELAAPLIARKREEADIHRQKREAAARFVFPRRPHFPGVRVFAVMGTQHTGTDLLRHVLNSHPRLAMVAEVLTPCAPPGQKRPETPIRDEFQEETAAAYQLPGSGPGLRLPGLNSAGHWGNFLRTLPGGTFPAETPADAERLLDRYFDFLLELIRRDWVGSSKADVQAIGIDIKYSHLRCLAPRDWDATLPSFLLRYLRSREVTLIHATRDVVPCAIAAVTNRLALPSGSEKTEGLLTLDPSAFMIEARRIVRERDEFLRQTAGCSLVAYGYEELLRELATADSVTRQIPPGDGPLNDIAAVLGVPFQFSVPDFEMPKRMPLFRFLSNSDEIVCALQQSELREYASQIRGEASIAG